MSDVQARKGSAFKALHEAADIFVMPNAWNAGSACILEAAGFLAVGTTSAGIAYNLGLPDYVGELTRDTALEETNRICNAVDIPVSADAENGYGHDPELVAETINKVAETGAVGASIEDYSASYGKGLYNLDLAIERISEFRLEFPVQAGCGDLAVELRVVQAQFQCQGIDRLPNHTDGPGLGLLGTQCRVTTEEDAVLGR